MWDMISECASGTKSWRKKYIGRHAKMAQLPYRHFLKPYIIFQFNGLHAMNCLYPSHTHTHTHAHCCKLDSFLLSFPLHYNTELPFHNLLFFPPQKAICYFGGFRNATEKRMRVWEKMAASVPLFHDWDTLLPSATLDSSTLSEHHLNAYPFCLLFWVLLSQQRNWKSNVWWQR